MNQKKNIQVTKNHVNIIVVNVIVKINQEKKSTEAIQNVAQVIVNMVNQRIIKILVIQVHITKNVVTAQMTIMK